MAIALDLSLVTPAIAAEISKVCTVKPSANQYNEDPKPVFCYAINKNEGAAYIPMGAWRNFLDVFPDRDYPKTKVVCKKTLYTLETDPKGCRDQDIVADEAALKLEKDHTVFIACFPGWGKTSIGNYFAARLKLKTAILCHIDKVNEQWVEEFENFSNAKVQRIKGNSKLDPKADVYVFGVQKAATMSREDLQDIGLVIFDEAHIATITAFSVSLLRFQPKYVIGLSATPKRPDGMHKMLAMYFGPLKNFIVREEVKDFTVYKIETSYKPTIKYNMFQGKSSLDWTTVTNSLAYNNERQNFIAGLVIKHPDHRVMILSDRQQECDAIYDKLLGLGEISVLKLTGAADTKEKRICMYEGCSTKSTFNHQSEKEGIWCAKHKEKGMVAIKTLKKKVDTTKFRVLVAGMKKAGVGFNDPTLTLLILATDRKSVEQLEGRIRTVNNIIYDLVDDHKTLESHWRKRSAWYDKRGAVIETISMREIATDKTKIPSQRLLAPNKSK